MSKICNTQVLVNTIALNFLKNPSPHGLTTCLYSKGQAELAAKQMRSYARMLSMLSGREVVEKTMAELVNACCVRTVMTRSNAFSDLSKIYLITGDYATHGAEYAAMLEKVGVQQIAYKVRTSISECMGDIGSLVLGVESYTPAEDDAVEQYSWVPGLDKLRFTARTRLHIATNEATLNYSNKRISAANVDFSVPVSVPAVVNSRACDGLQTLN